MYWLLAFFAIAFVFFMVLDHFDKVRRRKTLWALRAEYKASLLRLQANPGLSDVRVDALNCGRALADYERSISGTGARGLFDETALANDISAYGGGSQR